MGRVALRVAGATLVAAAAAVAFAPVLRFDLAGDDFLLVQLAHRAAQDPRAAFAALDAFYRPSTTWTLMVDRAVHGSDAGGYHLTNLLLRVVSVLLAVAAARRLGLGAALAGAVALVWACSPLAAEPVYVVGARIDELLGIAWLALVALWPGAGERWKLRRVLAVGAVVAFAAFTKETWIVTCGLALVLEIACRRTRPAAALRTAALLAAPAVAYVGLHAALLPSARDYFSLSPSVLAKVPAELAAFLHLAPLPAAGFALGPATVFAALAVAALAVLAWRLRSPAGLVGTALLLLPQLPTLLVPFLPTRHTALPYLGFLLLLAGLLARLLEVLPAARRRAVGAAAAASAAAVWAAGLVTLRADLQDVSEISAAHAQLVREARAVARRLPPDRPVLVARAERHDPLRELAGRIGGTPKFFFHRGDDAYGLADTAAVLEWARGEDGVFCFPAARTGAAGARPGVLLMHERGRFVIAGEIPDAGAEAARLAAADVPHRVVRLTASPRPPRR
jgi:hypothetical protein